MPDLRDRAGRDLPCLPHLVRFRAWGNFLGRYSWQLLHGPSTHDLASGHLSQLRGQGDSATIAITLAHLNTKASEARVRFITFMLYTPIQKTKYQNSQKHKGLPNNNHPAKRDTQVLHRMYILFIRTSTLPHSPLLTPLHMILRLIQDTPIKPLFACWNIQRRIRREEITRLQPHRDNLTRHNREILDARRMCQTEGMPDDDIFVPRVFAFRRCNKRFYAGPTAGLVSEFSA